MTKSKLFKYNFLVLRNQYFILTSIMYIKFVQLLVYTRSEVQSTPSDWITER